MPLEIHKMPTEIYLSQFAQNLLPTKIQKNITIFIDSELDENSTRLFQQLIRNIFDNVLCWELTIAVLKNVEHSLQDIESILNDVSVFQNPMMILDRFSYGLLSPQHYSEQELSIVTETLKTIRSKRIDLDMIKMPFTLMQGILNANPFILELTQKKSSTLKERTTLTRPDRAYLINTIARIGKKSNLKDFDFGMITNLTLFNFLTRKIYLSLRIKKKTLDMLTDEETATVKLLKTQLTQWEERDFSNETGENIATFNGLCNGIVSFLDIEEGITMPEGTTQNPPKASVDTDLIEDISPPTSPREPSPPPAYDQIARNPLNIGVEDISPPSSPRHFSGTAVQAHAITATAASSSQAGSILTTRITINFDASSTSSRKRRIVLELNIDEQPQQKRFSS